MRIETVSPFRCRMWAHHDRLDTSINERTCRAEIESFSKHGQLVPVLGRSVSDGSTYQFELIYGARRLFVARHLNQPLRVEVRELSDREAIVALDIENRQRSDISPYERGLSYARWLSAGLFQSQEELSRVLKVSASQVSRLLKLTRLPPLVVDAFPAPSHICEVWGLALAELMEDPARRQATLRRARAICAMDRRPSGGDVIRQLLAAAKGGRRPTQPPRDEVVKDGAGTPLFRIRHQSRHVALLLPMETVSSQSLAQICDALVQILHAATPDVTECRQKRTLTGSVNASPGAVTVSL